MVNKLRWTFNHEYKVLNLAVIADGYMTAERILNEHAKQGWFVKAGYGNNVILERVKDEAPEAAIPASVQAEKQTERENPKRHQGPGPAPSDQVGKDRDSRP